MRGAFKLMNSWGKHWGNQGFIWIRYAHFADYCRHAYALMISGSQPIDFSKDMTPAPSNNQINARSLSGSFGFKLFTGEWFNNKPIFQEENVVLKNNFYILPDRKVGEQFQLNVQSDFKDGYIYVFSIDPVGKVEWHFPRAKTYDVKFQNQNETALMIGSGSVLTIPSQDQVLSIAHPGHDYLIVLFSETRIKPKYVQHLSQELGRQDLLIENNLPKLIQKHMIPFADINYFDHRMGFSVKTESQGKIVPLILKLESQ
jgi:hypothetical protein